AYDLIGFQTEDDCENFTAYLRAEIGLDVEDGIVTSRFGTSRLAVFPIGIDVDGFAAQAQRAASHPDVSRLRK
ncbi:alpha,alpha-trehalose-phosphate synthase, partial [Klebsiella pneumoniae]|nr:alpha,alpha-trehalose-phosphate synthase [Klebsiella pneumoniae]